MTEEWRPVVGYEDSYKVSSYGRVRSTDRLDSRGRRRAGKPLAPRRTSREHLAIALYANGTRRDYQLHHLVLEAFVGPRPPGMDGCHWNDDPSDNRASNLRWDTRSANAFDSVRNGRHHMAQVVACPKGHAYTTENTYTYPSGSRACRECRRIYRETHREERRAKGREYARRKRAARSRQSSSRKAS